MSIYIKSKYAHGKVCQGHDKYPKKRIPLVSCKWFLLREPHRSLGPPTWDTHPHIPHDRKFIRAPSLAKAVLPWPLLLGYQMGRAHHRSLRMPGRHHKGCHQSSHKTQSGCKLLSRCKMANDGWIQDYSCPPKNSRYSNNKLSLPGKYMKISKRRKVSVYWPNKHVLYVVICNEHPRWAIGLGQLWYSTSPENDWSWITVILKGIPY